MRFLKMQDVAGHHTNRCVLLQLMEQKIRYDVACFLLRFQMHLWARGLMGEQAFVMTQSVNVDIRAHTTFGSLKSTWTGGVLDYKVKD